jgi:hypothetical protein
MIDPSDHNQVITSCTEILPGLWLGNQAGSQDEIFLKKNNIKVIVNATKHIPSKIQGIKYWRVPINDPGYIPSINHDDVQVMIKMLPMTLEFMRNHREKGYNILVHCHAGAQRSATIVAAYLMKYCRYVLSDEAIARQNRTKMKLAVEKIINMRDVAFHRGTSVNFREALIYYHDFGL